MKPIILWTRARTRQCATALLLATFVAIPSGLVLEAQKGTGIPSRADAKTVLHVLNRLGFGARPGDIERVQKMGLAKYIDEQLAPDRIPDAELDARLASFETLSMSTRELAEKFYLPALEARRDQQLKAQKAEAKAAATDPAMSADPAMTADPSMKPVRPNQAVPPEVVQIRQNQQNVVNELMQARLLREAMSARQLNEVLVDFWFNHFNVFVGKNQVREYLPEYERDVIRPHVLGRFRDLLGAVAHSPAMLVYLDNWQSSTPNPTPEISPEAMRRLNDPRLSASQRAQMRMRLEQMRNQPQRPGQKRGLNENYGRELMELHTLGVDGGYTQQDVIDVARALTGWTVDRPQQGGSFMFNPRMHDTGEKTILGVRFPAGRGQDEGERVLDLLANHASTAHHIAFKLAQKFVADEPPPALVDRAAKTFRETKGDLREVVRAIVTSQEFFAPAAYRAKVKTPLEFVVSAVRASDATVTNAMPLIQALRQPLGMPLYGCQPPTGYSNTADAWVNTGALLSRMNFAVQLLSGGQMRPEGRAGGPGGRGPAGPPAFAPMRPAQLARAPIRVDVGALVGGTNEAARDRLIESTLAGDISAATRDVLAKSETPQQLLALLLGSPEFQRR